MNYPLAADVYAASVDGDLVLLDVAGDAYVCLPSAGETLDSTRSFINLPDTKLASQLISAGLIVTTGVVTSRERLPPIPEHDLLDQSAPASSVWTKVEAGLAWMMMARWYRGRSFAQLVDYAGQSAQRAPAAEADATERLSQVAIQFERLAAWAPWQGECLYRSFLLLLFLTRRGQTASWVFGVRTWPFQAHCWLQAEDVVLNDALERVAGFTPIFAVRPS